jgi:hypothetical protein
VAPIDAGVDAVEIQSAPSPVIDKPKHIDRNQPQPAATSRNQPQPAATSRNQPQPAATSRNQPHNPFAKKHKNP